MKRSRPFSCYRFLAGLLVVASLPPVLPVLAGDSSAPPTPAPLRSPCRDFAFAAEGAGGWILRFGKDGRVAWAFPAPMSRDVQWLPNGNVLFTYNEEYGKRADNPSGVMEVTPDKRVVFHFKTAGQVFSCERLPDGRTLVGAAGQGKVLMVDAEGRIAREIVVKNKPGHSCMRHVRATTNGSVLVAEESAQAVREYRLADGSLVRDLPVGFAPFSATSLPDGHLVVTGRDVISERDGDGREVRAIRAADHPELGIRWFAGLRVTDDGNLFVCNAGGKVPFVEFARDGRIVWQSHGEKSDIPAGHGVALIGAAAH